MCHSSDLAGDTVTLPNGSMLASILLNAGDMGDDVFYEDQATNSLEKYVSELTGMKAALFVSSGTMGNQLALRSWLEQPPYSVVCDRRSHIMEHECGMTSMFSQTLLIPVMPNVEKQAYLTLEEIIPNIVPDDGNDHGAPTRVIALENTIWGKVVPVEEVRRIADYARERGIKVHMDGARLWNACYTDATASLAPDEAVAAAKTRLREYCSLVDSVSLCFSKSLGAPAGSILVSNYSKFIQKARHFRKALGGGMRQVGVLSSPARVAVDEVFLSGVHMPRANAMAKRLQEAWIGFGGEIQTGLGQETNMVWLDLKKAQVKDKELVELAKEEGARIFGGRIATHYRRFCLRHALLSHLSPTLRTFFVNFRSNHLAKVRCTALEAEI